MEAELLNGDSSWLVRVRVPGRSRPLALLLDPWLLGVEVDGAGWFHTQTLGAPRADLPALAAAADAVLVALPFSDHCHEETLRALVQARSTSSATLPLPIYAERRAAARLRTGLADVLGDGAATLIELADFGVAEAAAAATGTAVLGGQLQAAVLPPASLLDPTHGALLLRAPASGAALIYAPHGYRLSVEQAAALRSLQARAPTKTKSNVGHDHDVNPTGGPTLLAPASTYALPWFLGGAVNLGLDAAAALAQGLGAARFHDTHSGGANTSTGLVTYLAARTRPPPATVRAALERAGVPAGNVHL